MGVVPNPDGMMTLAHSSVYIFWRYCCFQGAISTTRLAYLLIIGLKYWEGLTNEFSESIARKLC